jgi:hypothetical protein
LTTEFAYPLNLPKDSQFTLLVATGIAEKGIPLHLQPAMTEGQTSQFLNDF